MTSKRFFFICVIGLGAALVAFYSSSGNTTKITAGSFSIDRKQHSYRNWDTGSTTKYYTYDVRHMGKSFKFPGRRERGDEDEPLITYDATTIKRAYVVSTTPAALLVLEGDPNNAAIWNLLIETPQELIAQHVAYYTGYAGMAWLDGDKAEKIVLGDLLQLDAQRWLWIEDQTLLDRHNLHLYPLKTPEIIRGGAPFVTFSPDRKSMVRFNTLMDSINSQNSRPVILVNDIATGAAQSHDIDKKTMWFDDSRDIDRDWIDIYFEWRTNKTGQIDLHRRLEPKQRPYQGRISVRSETRGMEYLVRRLNTSFRSEVMALLASELGGRYTMDEPVRASSSSPAAPGPNTTLINDQIVSAKLDAKGQEITLYFHNDGLSVEGKDVASDAIVREISMIIDAQLLRSTGQRWIKE